MVWAVKAYKFRLYVKLPVLLTWAETGLLGISGGFETARVWMPTKVLHGFKFSG